MEALTCRDLKLGYDGEDIVHNLSLVIRNRDLVTIAGPNGCGKSTILKALSRNLKPRRGSIFLEQRDIFRLKSREVARKISFLPQSPQSPPFFTVRELVSYGRFPHAGWSGSLTKKDREKVDWALEATGLTPLAGRDISALSGGERQRAWIAMTLAQEAEILLFDEPTTFLDIHHQLEILELINELNKKMDRTIIMVLHDLNHAARFSNRIIIIKDGAVYTDGKPETVITKKTLEDVFRIEAKILIDNHTGCPFFIALESK